MVFDLESLKKIAELTVEIVDQNIRDSVSEKEGDNPNYQNKFGSSYHFPRVNGWGKGRYIIVGVGDSPKSLVFPIFHVYDSKRKQIIYEISRHDHPMPEGILKEIIVKENDPNVLIFVIQDS